MPVPAKNCGDRCILLKASRSNSLIIIPAITTSPMDAASHKCHFFILCECDFVCAMYANLHNLFCIVFDLH